MTWMILWPLWIVSFLILVIVFSGISAKKNKDTIIDDLDKK